MTTGRINQVAALGFPRFNREVKYITSQSKHERCSNPPESSRSTDFRGFCLEPRATQTITTNMCFRSRAANPRGPPVGPLGKSPSVPKAYLKVLAKVPGAFRKTRRRAILRPPPKLLSAGLRGVRSVLCVRFRIAYSHKPSLLAPVVPHAVISKYGRPGLLCICEQIRAMIPIRGSSGPSPLSAATGPDPPDGAVAHRQYSAH